MPGPTPKYPIRFQGLLDAPLKEALDAFVANNDMKAAQVIRTALREYLAKHGEKAA